MFSRTRLCSSIKLLFGELDCGDSDSFVKLPSIDGDPLNVAFQYYEPYELDRLIEGLEKTLCVNTADSECSSRVQELRSAASMDFSYDSSSETLKLQALWPGGTHAVSAKPIDGHKAEVGVFTTDPSAGNAHELGVGGILAAAPDEKKEPSILAFAVQSRHRRTDASFSAKFLKPHGLHPTLQLEISSAAVPADYEDQGGCGLHAYLTLPRTVFADRYQLADELFMASKNLSSLRYASQPVDLEMPEYKNPPWGSTVLVELAPPDVSADADSPWTAEIPLHLRYRAPAEGGYSETRIPYPAVFWACQATEKAAFSGNPWDRASLGYDALFKPTTNFWHVEPRTGTEGDDLTVAAKVPVLAPEKAGWVEVGTAATILVGFAWVLFSLFSAARGKGVSGGKDTRAKKEQ